jgi:phosphatidylethanolamine/phosphatidyl-N-methylethanolamine N-methyltransferase
MREPAAAVVSGLPLFTKPLRTRLRLISEAFGLLTPKAPFIQFTYSVVSPIPKKLPGVHARATERIWLNLPPAQVWVYRKG